MAPIRPSPRPRPAAIAAAGSLPRAIGVLVLGSILLATACGKRIRRDDEPGKTPPRTTFTAAEYAKAKLQWSFCVSCHGLEGRGDGPQVPTLAKKPRNMSDPTWQASVTDAHIYKVISEGGPAVGLDALMAKSPFYKGEVSRGETNAMVHIVRGFNAAAPAPGAGAGAAEDDKPETK